MEASGQQPTAPVGTQGGDASVAERLRGHAGVVVAGSIALLVLAWIAVPLIKRLAAWWWRRATVWGRLLSLLERVRGKL